MGNFKRLGDDEWEGFGAFWGAMEVIDVI